MHNQYKCMYHSYSTSDSSRNKWKDIIYKLKTFCRQNSVSIAHASHKAKFFLISGSKLSHEECTNFKFPKVQALDETASIIDIVQMFP